VIHEQIPLPVPCYDFAPLTEPTIVPLTGHFRYSQLAWRDGRWVQGSGTYSPWHSWFTVTSDSGFMRSSCRPQSELRPLLMGLAPPYGFATLCSGHCTMCAAQGIKGPCWFGVILTFLRIDCGSPLWHSRSSLPLVALSYESTNFLRKYETYFFRNFVWFRNFVGLTPNESEEQDKHRARVAQVMAFKHASQGTCWRQPCSTWTSVLVGSPSFLMDFTSLSSPGKVLRLLSNWATWSTACVSPRLFLWVLALRPYFPGGRLNALAAPLEGSTLQIASLHSLGRGIQGYLILFYAHAFVPQRQGRPSWLPSLLVFRSISTDFTPTPSVPSAPSALYPTHLFRSFKVKPWRFNRRCGGAPTNSLRPINPDNTCGFCLTAAAGTEFAPAYSRDNVTLCPCGPGSSRAKALYTPKGFFEHVASLVQGFPHWPIFSTAASRRSQAHVAVPVLGDELSFPLPVIALVSHYLTN